MRRVPSRELLDDDLGTPLEIQDSLADLRFLNRRFGGIATTTRMVKRVAQASGQRCFSMLDVAAGTGEMPRFVRECVQRRGIDLRLTMLDRRATHLTHLGDGENHVVGDALALPFCEDSFDLITCCLFVHHLSPEEVKLFVDEALRCARVAVLINDLIRHPLHLAMACAGRLIYRSRITCNDAPASVRQAYTTREIREILERNGVAGMEITSHYFYRMGVIVWKTPNAVNGGLRVDV
jgi:ubiquinone/menaquinone biosynthesis C-methylase UbiE